MVTIKSPREISLMKEAGRIAAMAHKAVKEAIKPGISTYELDQIAEKVIRDNGATPSFKGYNGFKGSICASINEVVVHGIPSRTKILKEGDIISVDIGACYKGYHGDVCYTYPVGKISLEDELLLKATEDALYVGLSKIKAGVHLGDVSNAIEEHAHKFNFSIVEEFTGHGVGSKLHEDPYIPNFGKKNTGIILKPGMTLAIEPMVNAGKKYVKILKDGWTTVTIDGKKSAHFEHSIVVLEDGYEILTKLNNTFEEETNGKR